MIRYPAIIVALALSAAVVHAGPCDKDLADLSAALTSTQLDGEKLAQINDMRKQAQALCEAGNDEEGLDVLAEAKAMIEAK